MATYAHIRAGVVLRLFTPPSQFADLPLSELMAPAIAEEMHLLEAGQEVVCEGWSFDGETFSPPPDVVVDPSALAAAARARRDSLLAASDWSQLPDAPADNAAWASYRQALRDVPDQPGFPADIAWPEAPA